MRYLVLLAGLLFALPGCGGGGSSGSSPLVSKGKTLYDLNCKSCHGAEGHGDGPSASVFNPPLRDFAKHPWRTSPDAETIKKSIVEGIPGTQMPNFKTMAPADVDAIVAYTLTLAPKEPAPKKTSRVIDFDKFGFAAIQPEKLAPPLEFVDGKFKTISLAELNGSWRVLHFWSKNGKEFEPDLKMLQKLSEEMKTVRFVVIGGDEHDPDELILASEGIVTTLPLFTVRNQTGIVRYEVKALPVTFILDSEGNLLARKDGHLDETKLVALLTTIMM